MEESDFSGFERLEIEKTISQLSIKYEDYPNIIKIKPNSLHKSNILLCKFLEKGHFVKTELKLRQENVPKILKKKENFFKYKIININTRLDHLK